MLYHADRDYFASKAIAFQSLNELQAFRVFGKEEPKPKSLSESIGFTSPLGGGMGSFYVILAWLIPLFAIAFYLFRKR